MSFLIICILYVIVLATCYLFIELKWRYYANTSDMYPKILALRNYNLLSRVWATDNNFFSLKLSAFRHTFIPLIFSALIWFVNIRPINTVLLTLALLYTLSLIPRYNVRKEDYYEADETSQTLLKPVKSACFSVIVCAFINYIVLFLSYGFRP